MKIEYSVLDPTGNITILVHTPVPVGKQPDVASWLMEQEPDAEQVGFLSKDIGCDIALRMAGGEFCGNASMSAAALAAMEAGRMKARMSVRVSGAAGPVLTEVSLLPDGSWSGSVQMPRPKGPRLIVLPGYGAPCPVMEFDGISHVILEEPMKREQAENLAPEWCAALGAEAVGLMFFDRKSFRLDPLVYVPAARTLCWENSCASGSTAVGVYLAAEAGRPVTAILYQPGGSLTVTADAEGTPVLGGTIRLRKTASLELPEELRTETES